MNPSPLPLTLYGGIDCDDTERVAGRLDALGVPYELVIIDDNPAAERFVIFINNGFRSTPTLVFGRERYKILITEPADEELAAVLARAGYSLPSENT